MFRFNSGSHLQPKPQRHPSPTQRDGAGNTEYLHISESNPLFTQGSSIFGSYNAIGPSQTLSALNIDIQPQNDDHSRMSSNNQEVHTAEGCNIKMETHFTDMMPIVSAVDCKQASLRDNDVWTSTETLDL
jgi:hypothetical protein